MVYKLLNYLDKTFGFDRAKAHCDIPCGIYDPIFAQIYALTVVRMVDLMQKLADETIDKELEYQNKVSRLIAAKEEHAEKCKHEVRVIFGDYIKKNHVEQFPELPTVFHKIMQHGSKARQTANRDNALALLEGVNHFAEIFWKTKDISTKKAKAPYPPGLDLVYPEL